MPRGAFSALTLESRQVPGIDSDVNVVFVPGTGREDWDGVSGVRRRTWISNT